MSTPIRAAVLTVSDRCSRGEATDTSGPSLCTMLHSRLGAQIVATDVCVPISRLAECVVETEQDLIASPLPCPIVGHVGDGNFHLSVLFDPNDPAEREKAETLAKRVSMRAIRRL